MTNFLSSCSQKILN